MNHNHEFARDSDFARRCSLEEIGEKWRDIEHASFRSKEEKPGSPRHDVKRTKRNGLRGRAVQVRDEISTGISIPAAICQASHSNLAPKLLAQAHGIQGPEKHLPCSRRSEPHGQKDGW